MNLFSVAVQQPLKMLENLDRWIDKAVANAKARGYDPEVLVGARLAPDMYPLSRQVQASCDSAKFLAARTTAKTPPAHADTETTIAELKARIATCVEYLRSFTEADFVDLEQRVVPLSFLPGKGLPAHAYVVEMALPNFYFHIAMAYAILRHNGVDVGKIDFMGGLPLVDL